MSSVTDRAGRSILLAGLIAAVIGLLATSPAAASFGVQAFYPTKTDEEAISSGDIDGDGDIDLASGGNQGYVSLLRNDGQGSFASSSIFVDVSIRSIGIGQFVGDSFPDLAIGNSYSVLVFKGDGSGSFAPDPSSSEYDTSATSFAAGDLNGDSIPDLATVNEQVEILLGSGGGDFGAPVAYAAGSGPGSVAISDLNGDGKLDLAVANSGSHDVSILLGNGDGTFGPAKGFPLNNNPESVYYSPWPIMSISIEDFDRNGAKDIAVSDSFAQGVSVLFGDGTGSLGAVTQVEGVANPTSITVADFNSDQSLDIAASQYSDGTLKILGGYGNGKFRLVSTVSAGGSVFATTSAQLNQDDLPDLASVNYNEGGVSVLLNKGPVARFGPIDVRAPVSARRNRMLTYRVAIPSAGDGTLKQVKLKVTGRGIRSRVLSLGNLPAGTVERLKVKVRPRLKGYYLRARFKATSANSAAMSGKGLTWVSG